MQWHGIEDQKVVNRGLAPLAKDLGLSLVATNDVHYLRHGDHVPHDILLCIGTARNVNDRDRLRYHGDQFYLKTGDEMVKTFGGEFPEAISNTVRIAERCNVDLSGTENHLPNFDVPEGFTLDGYFEHIVREGFAERLERLRMLASAGSLRHTIEEYEQRLSYEIEMIRRMRYPGYFLIVWDFIRYAREQGIAVGPGRGSAAGSLVAYCLRITDVDPLEYDLIFERFLNPERVSLPGYRHRFLRAAPRRGHRVRDAPVRPRERRADHHLRDDEGQGRRARRRARAGHPAGRGQQGRQADPGDARHDAREGRAGDAGPQGAGSTATPRSRSCSTSRAASKAWRGTRRPTPPAWSSRPARSPTTRRSTRGAATKSSRSGP